VSVTAEMVVTIAEVEVTDDYTIDLHVPAVHKKHLILSLGEAEELANEIIERVVEARLALSHDLANRGVAQLHHAFDTDGPVAS
jgi:hypothetical protein